MSEGVIVPIKRRIITPDEMGMKCFWLASHCRMQDGRWAESTVTIAPDDGAVYEAAGNFLMLIHPFRDEIKAMLAPKRRGAA